MKKLFITIPAFNEEKSIAAVIKSIPKKIPGISSIKILVWSDGSLDNTATVASEAGADYVFNSPRNFGLAYTFDQASKKAIELGADIVVNTDADNQYDQKEILNLVKPILDNKADIVSGDRQIATLSHMPNSKKYGNMIGSWVIRNLSESNIQDASSGFRAYNKKAIQLFRIFSRHTYTHETLIQAVYGGLSVIEVPVTFKKRSSASGQSRLIGDVISHILKSGLTIVRTILMFRALRLMLILGSIELFFALILSLRYLYLLLVLNVGVGHTQSLILASMLFTMSLISYLLGIIADLIAVNRKIMIGW